MEFYLLIELPQKKILNKELIKEGFHEKDVIPIN